MTADTLAALKVAEASHAETLAAKDGFRPGMIVRLRHNRSLSAATYRIEGFRLERDGVISQEYKWLAVLQPLAPNGRGPRLPAFLHRNNVNFGIMEPVE